MTVVSHIKYSNPTAPAKVWGIWSHARSARQLSAENHEFTPGSSVSCQKESWCNAVTIKKVVKLIKTESTNARGLKMTRQRHKH